MKRIVLLVILIVLLASCASENFKPVGTVLFLEQGGRLHIQHTNGHEYVCMVGDKFAELVRDGFVNAGEQFDCTGLLFFQKDSVVTF